MADFKFEPLGMLGKSISVQEMTGNDQVYLRITKLYKADDGEWRPSKQGISIPKDLCFELRNILNKFLEGEEAPQETKSDVVAADVSELV